MRKLIRDEATKAFLTPDDCWTTEVEQARVFVDDAEIFAVLRAKGIRGAQVYYLFGAEQSEEYDFAITLQDFRRGPCKPLAKIRRDN